MHVNVTNVLYDGQLHLKTIVERILMLTCINIVDYICMYIIILYFYIAAIYVKFSDSFNEFPVISRAFGLGSWLLFQNGPSGMPSCIGSDF